MRHWFYSTILALVMMPATAVLAQTRQEGGPLSTRQAIIEEMAARPLAGAADIYKLVHQSVFGPGHLIKNEDAARDYLERETASLGPTPPGEPLFDDIGNGMLRVNLRPFRDAGGSKDGLLRAMIETANNNNGTAEDMATGLEAARLALVGLGMDSLADELAALAERHAENGYPISHHSQDYRQAYYPAYRVVDRASWAEGAGD